MVPLIESILAEAGGPLVIVAPKVSDKVLGTLKQYADKSLLETLVWQLGASTPQTTFSTLLLLSVRSRSLKTAATR